MKTEYTYSSTGNYNFEIKSHIGNFYLFLNGLKIARADDIKVLKSYIDGFSKGVEYGEKIYFDKFMEVKKELKKVTEK